MTIETAAEWIAEARNLQERGEWLLPKLNPELQVQARVALATLEAAIAEATEHATGILPANWGVWGEPERKAWQEIQDQFEVMDQTRKTLEAALLQPIDRAIWLLVDKLEVTAAGLRFCAVDLIRNRLKRYRPDLADLIDFATSNPAVYQSDLPHGDSL